jgi:orotidine-5'-phosphate decarboxylase
MPILIPGVGAQRGDLEQAVRYGVDSRGKLAIINASRQVLYASRGRDFAEAARRTAQSLRDAVRQALAPRKA